MATSDKPVTNGEYYDYTIKSWVVQCGSSAVPIRKQDKDGKPMEPPKVVATTPTIK